MDSFVRAGSPEGFEAVTVAKEFGLRVQRDMCQAAETAQHPPSLWLVATGVLFHPSRRSFASWLVGDPATMWNSQPHRVSGALEAGPGRWLCL